MPSPKKKPKKIKIKLTQEEREELLKNFKIRPNSDIFFVTYFSNPKNEKVLVNLINAVITDSKWPPIVSAEVLNPFGTKTCKVGLFFFRANQKIWRIRCP